MVLWQISVELAVSWRLETNAGKCTISYSFINYEILSRPIYTLEFGESLSHSLGGVL